MTTTCQSRRYLSRRGEIGRYFDRTALEAWRDLTSEAPLGRIRTSVRAGRDAMRSALLSRLPPKLDGVRVLDAGCGTGALAVALARRGADVTAVDLSDNLIELARQRLPDDVDPRRLRFSAGDMIDSGLGTFDYVVAMDSLIHYPRTEVAAALAALATRTETAVLFTRVPLAPLLTVKRAVGRLFPQTDRAPDVRPVRLEALRADLMDRLGDCWSLTDRQRIHSGFYTAEALKLERR